MTSTKIQRILNAINEGESSGSHPTGHHLVWPGQATREITAHFFESTEGAYDSSQCDGGLIDGDLLIVPSERAIGILTGAWPMGITREFGSFHKTRDDWDSIGGGRYLASYNLALNLAERLGWDIPAIPQGDDEPIANGEKVAFVAAVDSYVDGVGLNGAKVGAYALAAGVSFEEASCRVEAAVAGEQVDAPPTEGVEGIPAGLAAAFSAAVDSWVPELGLNGSKVETYALMAGISFERASERVHDHIADRDRAGLAEARETDAINGLLAPVDLQEIQAAFAIAVRACLDEPSSLTAVAAATRFARVSGLRREAAWEHVQAEAERMEREAMAAAADELIGEAREEYAPQSALLVLSPWIVAVLGVLVGAIFGRDIAHLAYICVLALWDGAARLLGELWGLL